MRRTQEERSATTQAAIVRAARRLFSERGYSGTSLEDIVGSAGVTRGALYHHFSSKAEVFRAVVEQIDDELLGQVLDAAAMAPDEADWIGAAARAYVEICGRLKISRIGSEIEAVLGQQAYREISNARCLPLIRMAGAASPDRMRLPGDPDTLAALILGALDEAVSLYSQASGRAARRRILETVDVMIRRLLGAPG